MVYHFFTKWKGLKSQILDIAEEINLAEIYYKRKIKLFKIIYDNLKNDERDITNMNKLLRVYKSKKYSQVYEKMLNKLTNIVESKLLPYEEIIVFIDLINYISKETKEQNELAVKLLEEMLAGGFPQASKFYELHEPLRAESEFLKIEDEKFKKIEDLFLIRKEPGYRTRGYKPIIKAIQEGIVKIEKNKLWIGTKPIQGLKIIHNKIIIKGDHYSSMQNARWIQGEEYVAPSIRDPYSYFVEKGKLAHLNQMRIQKILGISNAEAMLSLEVDIFPEQLYIKVEPKKPVKFAIALLRREQVLKVIKMADMIS